MSTSDTHTTAASAALARLRNDTSDADDGSTGPAFPMAAGSGARGPAGTAPEPPSPQAPSAPAPQTATHAVQPPAEHLSERIAHPVPRHHGDEPRDMGELLHPDHPQPRTGPPFRHLDSEDWSGADPAGQPGPPREEPTARTAATPPKPSTAPRVPGAPAASVAAAVPAAAGTASTDAPADAVEPSAVSGGFRSVNGWLDALPEPEWERIGDKIYSSPATFKAKMLRARVERARAAETRERTRLVEAAHAEALAEAAQREEAEHAARFRAEQEAVERQLLEEERRERLLEQQRAAARPTEPRRPASPEELAALVASAKAAIDRQQALAEPLYVAPYTLPDDSPNPEPTSQDTIRRWLSTIAAAALGIAVLFGLEAPASGAFPGQTTTLSLAPAAFPVVAVMAAWAFAASLFAWHPSQASAVRQRAVGRTFPPALLACVLWLVSVNAGSRFLAFCTAAVAAGLLLATVRELNRYTARSRPERMLTDAPVSLMAGFFPVVAAASLAELLQSWNVFAFPVVLASLAVLGLGYLAIGFTRTERGRIVLALGFTWGMFWLMMPRLVGPERSVLVAVLAAMTGFVVLVATENRRYQINHAEHRAALGKRTVF